MEILQRSFLGSPRGMEVLGKMIIRCREFLTFSKTWKPPSSGDLDQVQEAYSLTKKMAASNWSFMWNFSPMAFVQE